MLQIYQSDGKNIIPLENLPEVFSNQAEKTGETCQTDYWLDLTSPSIEELETVSGRLSLPLDFFTDSLDPAERSHIMRNGNSVLIIVRVSRKPIAGQKYTYTTLPIGIIITAGAVVTICSEEGLVRKLVENKLHAGQSRERIRIALTVLQQVSIHYIDHLQEMDALTGEIEEAMRKSTRNEDLSRMLQLEKNLVYFLTALKANAMVLDKMLTSGNFTWQQDENEILVDALTESKQAVEMAEIYTQITGNMNDVFASMISNNMNSVMKFLAAITLILMAPTIIVGLYGMNVPLPFQDSPLALAGIIAVTVAACAALWKYLLKKHWM